MKYFLKSMLTKFIPFKIQYLFFFWSVLSWCVKYCIIIVLIMAEYCGWMWWKLLWVCQSFSNNSRGQNCPFFIGLCHFDSPINGYQCYWYIATIFDKLEIVCAITGSGGRISCRIPSEKVFTQYSLLWKSEFLENLWVHWFHSIWFEREREREKEKAKEREMMCTCQSQVT